MIAAKLAQYWRDSLADSARSELDADRLEGAAKVTLEEAAAGALNPARIAVLFENADANKKQAKPHSSTAEPLSVLLCLRLLRREVRRSERQGKTLGLIWLPAELTPVGILHPSPNLPWIPRDLLEPIYEAELTLGDVHALDAYLTEHPQPVNRENPESPPRWGDAWAYAEVMFRDVAGVSLQMFQAEGYQKSESVYLLREREDDQKIPPRHILKLYDHLLRHREVPPLLERYMLLDPPPPRPFLTAAEEVAVSAQHVGQMSAEYPLLPSQRRALYHLLAETDSGILAVSGPPGTGKTTLLQSVIASLWVEAALAGGEPPVIVATSSNNQAISNVIARLGEAAEDDTALRGRWLPDVSSYGISCQSAGKEEPNTQTSDRFSGGFMLGTGENAETRSYVGLAESHFLAACARWAGQSFADVGAAVRALHSALTEVAEAITQGPHLWLELEDARRVIAEQYEGGVEEAIESLSESLGSVKQAQRDLEKERLAWLEFDSSLFWLKLFGFLPPVKQQWVDRTELYFAKRDYEVRPDVSSADSVKASFASRKDELRSQEKTTRDALARAQTDLDHLEHATAAWFGWCKANHIQGEPSRFLEETDTRLRCAAFKLATHYWEGRWLLDMKGWLTKHPSGKDFQSEADQAARWRRYAKLAPCVISTFYMLPAYFDVYKEGSGAPFYNFIDLLIVDEAGQAAPDVAGASFALAKRAFVIGDTKQLEPVQKLSRGVDRGNISAQNLGQHGLTLEALSASGLAASEGNVMRVAENANRYQEGADLRNLLLAEHLRCVPEIMAYFNALAYEKQLAAIRKPLKDYPLPHLGYAHIPAESVKDPRSRSRTNPTEAEVIADWLVEQGPLLEAHYERPLEEIVAVVTPFRQQANLIERQLKRKRITKLKVGTVHVLQGGERPVVLFSSVYGAKDRASYFFDKGVNMLNVATSRARDSFLVFGNMAVFHLPSTKPSGLLGTYLFANSENELTNIRLPVRAGLPTQTRTVHLDTLEAHRDTLERALQEATRNVHITSPFLTEDAVLADAVPRLVANAVQRKVTVTVYTDPQLNQRREGGFKASFLAAQGLLEASGATVALVRAEHSKTLIVDDAVLVEGSFNWLSASRDSRSAFQRRERSLRYEGGEVTDIIQNILADTQKRIMQTLPSTRSGGTS